MNTRPIETPCDKCGRIVPVSNSAKRLDAIVNGFFGFFTDRHVYPTATCEGSPSRLRMVETDATWKAAWEKLQKMAAENSHEPN